MEKQLLIVTDAAASANSSTTREVVDLISECNKRGVVTHIYSARVAGDKGYEYASNGTYSWAPFYKSQSLLLRFVSENLLGVSLALKYIFLQKNKKNISTVLWITPSIFTIYLIIAIKKISKADVYLMLRDMFPYWLASVGRLHSTSCVYKFLVQFANYQMKLPKKIGVESEGAKKIFLKLYPEHIEKCEMLFNWMDCASTSTSLDKSGQPIRFIYAGNLGFAQGYDLIFSLISKYANSSDVEFHFIGRGEGFSILAKLKSSLSCGNLYFYEQLPVEYIDNFISQFDIGLIFLKNDLNGSNIPGKSMGYLLNGLPVFGSVNPECDLSTIVRINNFGFIDVSGDEDSFLDAAEMMLNNFRNGKYSSKNIGESAKKLFSPSSALQQILNSRVPRKTGHF